MAEINNDYKDWLSQHSGVTDADIDADVAVAGNLKDIYDTSIGRLIRGHKKGRNTKSIIGMASRNTFDFPVFVSKSVPLDYATATNQLLEQLYAGYVQQAISQNPVVDAKSLKNGGFLANFQTNITKYVEYADEPFQTEACHNEIFTEDATFTFDMLNCSRVDADEILECMDYEPLSEFEHFFQEAPIRRNKIEEIESDEADVDQYGNPIPDDDGNTTIRHRDQRSRVRRDYKDIEAELNISNTDAQGHDEDGNDDEFTQHRRDVMRRRMKSREDLRKARADADIASKDNKVWADRESDRREDHAMKMMNRAPEMLKDSDMQKMNSMKPLLMRLQMRVVDRGGKIAERPVEFVIGVHVHTRLIDPETWPDVVKYPLKEMNEITRHVKWKAGELRFMRDIVFQIKEKKQTAIDSRDPKKKWYRRLYELSHSKGDANVSGKISGNATTGLIPNATIMLTNGDVENVKSQTKLDVMKPSLAKRLCKELFLMSLVVIDQDAESIKLFIPDIYGDWDVHSLASVEKQLAELSTAGSKTRDLFKMLK